MSWISTLFTKIEGFFTSGKAQQVAASLETLVPLAAPIVQEIAALTPNKTVQEVEAAYTKYAVPLIGQIANDPTTIGNALLNLATTVMQKNHAPTAAVSLLNTAVQIAVTMLK